MAVGKEDRGPLWVDGRFTVRVRGPGPEPGRIVRLRRPFALIGRRPGAEIRIDDPAVDDHHAFLLLDRRGVFGVDLLTRTGTRFAGAAATSARLGAGDILEVAGRRVEILQLRVDGSVIDPPLSDDDPLAEADASTPGRPDPRAARRPRPALDARVGPGLRRPGRGLRHPDRGGLGLHDALRAAPRPVDGPRDRPRRPPDAAQRPAGRRGLGAPRRRRPDRRPGPLHRPGRAAPRSARGPDDRPDRRELRGRPRPARRAGRGPPGGPARPGAHRGLARAGRAAGRRSSRPSACSSPTPPRSSRPSSTGSRPSAARSPPSATRSGRHQATADRAPEPLRLDLPPRLSTDSVESAAWLLQRLNGLEIREPVDLEGPDRPDRLLRRPPDPLRTPPRRANPEIAQDPPGGPPRSRRRIVPPDPREPRQGDARALPGPSSPDAPLAQTLEGRDSAPASIGSAADVSMRPR